MPLPSLDNFEAMIAPLHQAALLLSPLKHALFEKRNNWLHLPLDVHPYGVSSGKLPQGGELRLDFKEATYIYERPYGTTITLSLADHTQESLFLALLKALRADELSDFLDGAYDSTLAATFIERLTAKYDKVFMPLEELSGQQTLVFDTQTASDYADVQYTIFTGIARFRARLVGHLTPIVVWPEHFDLSTLWFADPAMDDYKQHINIGFAPYTPGMFPRPYLYAYAYPYPDDVQPPPFPEPAFFNTEGFKGVVVHYDDIRQAEDVALFVEHLSARIFTILQSLFD